MKTKKPEKFTKITKKQIAKKERIEKNKKLKEWSRLVRERDKNKCVICKESKYLHAHHILPKEAKIYNFLKFDVNNGISLCPKHHKYSYEISPHKNPFTFMSWLKNERFEQYAYLLNKTAKNENN